MAIRFIAPLLLALLLAGCSGFLETSASGRLYTNTIRPHSRDFHNSPVGDKQCLIDEHQLREPVSGYGVSVEWTADLILAAANQAGISRISYTELQTVSFLLGVYRRQRLIIHGD
jgi:hypothetical protein